MKVTRGTRSSFTRTRQAKQRVPDDEAGVIVGEMGELPPARDVADGIDAPVGGLEPLVDHDPVAVAGDAGLLERETVRVRPAAGRDQEMAACDRLLRRRRRERRPRSSAPVASTRTTATLLRMSTPSRASAVEHDVGAFGVFARERLRRFQHRDRGAEPAKGLRQLEPDRHPRR